MSRIDEAAARVREAMGRSYTSIDGITTARVRVDDLGSLLGLQTENDLLRADIAEVTGWALDDGAMFSTERLAEIRANAAGGRQHGARQS